jgi:hypothetical protein
MNQDELKGAIALLEANGYEVIPPQSIAVVNDEFEQWWNLYNKKRGKPKCLKKWLHMSKKDRQACITATPKYVASVTNKVYQKDPLTYLNGRCWEDEIYSVYDESEQQQKKSSILFARKAAEVFSSD